MGKRDGFWDSVSNSPDGEIAWPADSAARTGLARDVFGARVIGAMDSVIEDLLDVAAGKPPTPGSPDYESDEAFRSTFRSMTAAQQAAVGKLVKEAASGSLYWILVKLTHFPSGSVHIRVEPWGTNQEPYPESDVHEPLLELPTLWLEWIERFSDHVELPSPERGRWA